MEKKKIMRQNESRGGVEKVKGRKISEFRRRGGKNEQKHKMNGKEKGFQQA